MLSHTMTAFNPVGTEEPTYEVGFDLVRDGRHDDAFGIHPSRIFDAESQDRDPR